MAAIDVRVFLMILNIINIYGLRLGKDPIKHKLLTSPIRKILKSETMLAPQIICIMHVESTEIDI